MNEFDFNVQDVIDQLSEKIGKLEVEKAVMVARFKKVLDENNDLKKQSDNYIENIEQQQKRLLECESLLAKL